MSKRKEWADEQVDEWVDHLKLKVCPCCQGPKHAGPIVCVDCWAKLRDKTKIALTIADVYSIGRRKEFYRQLAAGFKPQDILIMVSDDNYERTPFCLGVAQALAKISTATRYRPLCDRFTIPRKPHNGGHCVEGKIIFPKPPKPLDEGTTMVLSLSNQVRECQWNSSRL